MARNWRKGKLLKAAVGGTVVGLAGGATALAGVRAASPDPTPVDAPSDDSVSLDLEDGTIQVTVDDALVDDLDTTVDSPDTESVATPPGVETPASPQSADSPEDVDSPAAVDDQDSVDAQDDSPATVDTDGQGEDNDGQGEDESVDNEDQSADSD